MAKKKQIELTIEEKLRNALVPKEEQLYKIPNNWCWTYFKDIFYIENGYAFKKIDYKKEGIPLVRISNIENGIVNINECIYVNKLEKNEEKYVIEKGDLLIALSGATTGKNGVYYLDEIAYLNQRIGNIKIKNKEKVLNEYRNYYIALKNEDILNLAYGGAQPNISPKVIEFISIPLSPINEQQRIVNRIESLFTKLDRAKELIENTLAQFEQNKMAILHKAFTGELTVKWRKENNIDLSSWEKIKLGKVLLPMQTKKPTGQFFRYIDIDAIDNKRQIVKAPKLILTEKAPSRASRGVETGNILFSMVRPYLKNIAQIDSDLSDCIASTGFYVCRCKPELNSRFLYYLFIFDKTIDYLMQFMKGDNSPSIRKDDLLNMKIDLPTI